MANRFYPKKRFFFFCGFSLFGLVFVCWVGSGCRFDPSGVPGGSFDAGDNLNVNIDGGSNNNTNSNTNTNNNENTNTNTNTTNCGNGVIDEGEVCDGTNLDEETCQTQGFYTGTLLCLPDCSAFDISSCEGYCGDGLINGLEDCDDSELGGATCNSVTGGTMPLGELSCNESCEYYTQDCHNTCTEHSECPLGKQCSNAGNCVSVGNTCDDSPFVLSSAGLYQHTLENLTNDYNGGNTGLGCQGFLFDDAEGADRVYEISLQANDYITVWVDPTTNWNPVLFLTRTCPVTNCMYGRDIAEYDPAPERIDYIAQSNETVYLVVDGNDNFGAYNLHVTRGSGSEWRDAESVGDVIYNEALPNPDRDRKEACEWFEIYNTQAVALNLEGLEFSSPGGNFEISTPLIIQPHDYLVLAYYAEIQHTDWHNCGVKWVSWCYWWGTEEYGFLYHTYDCLIEIWRGGTLIDDVDYASDWPFSEGRSMYLCTDYRDHSDNDSSGNWLLTPQEGQYGYSFDSYTNYATPGEMNPSTCD